MIKEGHIEIMLKMSDMTEEKLQYSIIKEYILDEMDKLRKEINDEEEHARFKHIPNHLINIFVKKLTERKEFLNHLLNEILYKEKQLKTKQHEN